MPTRSLPNSSIDFFSLEHLCGKKNEKRNVCSCYFSITASRRPTFLLQATGRDGALSNNSRKCPAEVYTCLSLLCRKCVCAIILNRSCPIRGSDGRAFRSPEIKDIFTTSRTKRDKSRNDLPHNMHSNKSMNTWRAR